MFSYSTTIDDLMEDLPADFSDARGMQISLSAGTKEVQRVSGVINLRRRGIANLWARREDMKQEQRNAEQETQRRKITPGPVLEAIQSQEKPEAEIAPFYDPIDDDKNDMWAAKQRQGRKSDAVLSCPACFTILCIDCQRHELHVNQYRAMFVRNCKIIETERLQYPADRKRKRNQRRKKQHEEDSRVGGPGMVRLDPNDAGVDEVFKPVECGVCGVEVAVLDIDEVYHFFHVVPTFS